MAMEEAAAEVAAGRHSQWKRAWQLVSLVTLAAALALGYVHLKHRDELYGKKRSLLLAKTVAAAGGVERALQPVIQSTRRLADRLSRDETSPAALEDALKAMVWEGGADYYGGSVTHQPDGRAAATRPPYYSKSPDDGRYVLSRIEDDFTKAEWYAKAMQAGDRWSAPYWDPSGKIVMVTRSAVFRGPAPSQAALGVVTIDVSMDRIKQIIASLDTGANGSVSLLTAEGAYLYHADSELVRTLKTLSNGHPQDSRSLRRLREHQAAAAAQAGRGVIEYDNAAGHEAWVVHAPVPGTGWSLQTSFDLHDLVTPTELDQLRREKAQITIAVIGFLAALAMLLLRAHQGREARLWGSSAAVSALLLIGLGTIWYLALTYSHVRGRAAGAQPQIVVTDRGVLNKEQTDFAATRSKNVQPPPVYLPTGIHIETMELDGANTVSVTGQIWQRWPAGYEAGSVRPVLFSAAKDAKFELLETRPVAGHGERLKRWLFQARLRTEFDHSRYPMEIEKIRIGMSPLERGGNDYLVPDLDAYSVISASEMPGLDLRFVSGWEIENASFVLRAANERTTFGRQTKVDVESPKDLYYEIGIKRVFVDAFISNLTPLIVASIALFSLLFLPRETQIHVILGVSVSLFFVVVYAHLAIRRNLAIGEIFYLEYFFFVVYAALLAVPVNAFRATMRIQIPLLEYRDGLVMKLLYWPVMLGTFFAITVWKFY